MPAVIVSGSEDEEPMLLMAIDTPKAPAAPSLPLERAMAAAPAAATMMSVSVAVATIALPSSVVTLLPFLMDASTESWMELYDPDPAPAIATPTFSPFDNVPLMPTVRAPIVALLFAFRTTPVEVTVELSMVATAPPLIRLTAAAAPTETAIVGLPELPEPEFASAPPTARM